MDIIKLINNLNNELWEYSKEYYVYGESNISDSEYDKKYNDLKKLVLENNYRPPNCILDKVGYTPIEISEFKKEKHSTKMLSLDNTFNEKDIKDFTQRVFKLLGFQPTYVLEYKVDGISFVARYKNGKLVKGITRGDGIIGEDITEHLKQVNGIPLKIDYMEPIEIRGELYIPIQTFIHINNLRLNNDEKVFANPRNLTSGTMRQLNTKYVKERGVSAFAYYIVNPMEHRLNSQTMVHDKLQSFGFDVPIVNDTIINNTDQLIEIWNKMKTDRTLLPYDIDGLVIKVNDFKYYDKLGETSHAPRWAIAFKFDAEKTISQIKDIIWSGGRTGNLTPVAKVKPVELSGSVVQNVNLHNMAYVLDMNIKIGDWITIQKAGEIIPQVVEILKDKRDGTQTPINIPTRCPYCGSNTYQEFKSPFLKCSNKKCPSTLKAKITQFVSRDAMNISGLGKKIIDKFVSMGYLESILDIYHLPYNEIMKLDGFGKRSMDNLKEEIEKSKNINPEKFLYALGIDLVGRTASNKLIKKWKSIDEIKLKTITDFNMIDGFGEEISKSLYNWFHEKDNIQLLEEFRKVGIKFNDDTPREPSSNKFIDSKFVITGTLSKPRNYFKELIEKHGGKVSSSISKNTDYLLCGENAGSKLEKAITLKITCLSEDEFINMLGG